MVAVPFVSFIMRSWVAFPSQPVSILIPSDVAEGSGVAVKTGVAVKIGVAVKAGVKVVKSPADIGKAVSEVLKK
jgi:hypothetical protein